MKPFPDVEPGTTIESAVHNGTMSDVETDLNAPRPVIAGGTGATSAAAARDNLDAEVASQTVTNYDSHVFEAGSFWSTMGATGAPSANILTGVCTPVAGNPAHITLAAIDNLTGTHYTRIKYANVWGAWTVDGTAKADITYVNAQDALRVAKVGDTMTGDLTINKSSPTLILQKTANGQNSQIFGWHNSVARWQLILGDNSTETGSNIGSDFALYRYNDAGSGFTASFGINRATGRVSFGEGNTLIYGSGAEILTITTSVTNTYGLSIKTNDRGIYIGAAVDGYAALFSRAASFNVGNIYLTGTTTQFNTASDGRLKEDLKSFDAGNIVDDTNVYDFAWKSTGARSYGIVAQQANEIYPAAVTHDEKVDEWFVDYSKYVPVLLQELKALRARVAELEEKLEARVQPT